MFTIRNVGGVSLFLFGTTFLWLTPMFASQRVSTRGTAWTLSNTLALAALVGFTAATWGLFQRASWWETVAVIAAVIGTLVLVPYWLAAEHSGETTPGFNVLIHVVGNVSVFVLLLVPTLEQWVDRNVMG